MHDPWSGLLACLTFDARGSDTRFTAPNQHLEYHRVFGGQLLAQFVCVASATSPDKSVKSLHVVVPREGRADEPVVYDVNRHHEGRSFGTLSITATQAKGPIGVALGFHALSRARADSPIRGIRRRAARAGPPSCDILTGEGELVASYAQESLLRIPN